MTETPHPFSVESLLAQRPWVEALARSLVRDAATADDVVQQTWLAAFTSPPRDAAAARGWLARVVRNAAAESHRRTVRRAAREAAAPPPRAEPGPAEIVEKAEAHRRVVEAVMALAEPYRGTVLLRWFEGLEADEVARRTGVPVETARTRLKRAHAMLRDRLDREHGGDGRAWVIAMVPLAGELTAVQGGIVMASTKTLAAGVAGLVLGIAATWGMVAAGAPPGVAANPGPAPGPGAGGPGPVAGDPQTPPAAPAPSTGDAPDDAATRLLAAHRPELPPVSPEPIRARVLTTDGTPLPGAVVRTTAVRPLRPGANRRGVVRPQSSAEDSIRLSAEYVNWTAATTREARTDASGECVLRDPFDADQQMTAMADGWTVTEAQGTVWPIRPGATVEFVATRVVAVPVEVLLGDGSPPEGAVTVRWTRPQRGGGGSGFTWRPAETVAEVEPGTWEFTAQMGRDVRAAPVTVTIPADSALPAVSLRLVATNSVSGVARPDPSNAWWTGVDVWLLRRGARARADSISRTTARPPHFDYRFEKMEDGEYDVAVSLDGATVFASAPVTVRGGPARGDVSIPAVPWDSYVSVRVTGPDGLPIGPDRIAFPTRVAFVGGGGVGGAHRSFPLEDGRFVVPIRTNMPSMDLTAVGPVRWTLEAILDGGASRFAPFVPGQAEPVEISFANEARFEPRWIGVDGTPLAGRMRAVLGMVGQSFSEAFNNRGINETVNNRGPRSVIPGRYIVTICIARPGELIHRPVARVPVELQAGDNVVPLTVPPLHTLTLRVPGAPVGTEVSVTTARRPRDVPVPGVKVDAAGSATASELPSGTYRIEATIAGESLEMIVAIDSSRELTFAPTTIAGLDVAVEDERGSLFTSGLRDRDRIVAIDGVEIDTVRRADAVLYAARTRPKIDVDVLRGGSRMRLSIEPRVLLFDGELGGSWTPVPR